VRRSSPTPVSSASSPISAASGTTSSRCSACRGSALVSLELLSRDSPGVVNSTRRTLHELASEDPNGAVRRLAIVCLKNGTPARETIVILGGLADSDDEDKQLRETAEKVAAFLQKKANVDASARRSGGR